MRGQKNVEGKRERIINITRTVALFSTRGFRLSKSSKKRSLFPSRQFCSSKVDTGRYFKQRPDPSRHRFPGMPILWRFLLHLTFDFQRARFARLLSRAHPHRETGPKARCIFLHLSLYFFYVFTNQTSAFRFSSP